MWLKDDSPLPPHLNYSSLTLSATSAQSSLYLSNLNISFTGDVGVVALLIISTLHRGDNGTYSCNANNSLPETGTFSDTSTISLTVLGMLFDCACMFSLVITCIHGYHIHWLYTEKPAPPLDLLIVSFTARSVYLQWRPPTFTGFTNILGYNINLRNVDLNTDFQPVQSDSTGSYTTTALMYNITSGLTPYTTYEFTIAACNKVGCSGSASPVSVRTASASKCLYES